MSTGNEFVLKNSITLDDFCTIQESVGFGRPDAMQAEIAIQNSLYILSAVVAEKTVGMGRVIGDRAKIYYIQDLFIVPEYQNFGIGTAIIQALLAYIKEDTPPGRRITVGLMAAKGKEKFYIRHGFRSRPNDWEGAGMVMQIEAEG